jgi:UDP-N-acetylglucosamine 2-epimerase (non-hydrolysing)
MKVAVVFGTRPEAIKMAPVVKALRSHASAHRGSESRCPCAIEPVVYVTGQHRDMLDQVLNRFGIEPQADLDIMRPNQGLADLTARLLIALHTLFTAERPDIVLVHGDTTTAFAAALAAYYRRIPVGHVEAGLRTGNPYSPFPEEINRKIVDGLSRFHFAPTAQAVANLRAEGIAADGIEQTGNTIIDALLLTLEHVGGEARRRLLDRYADLESALAPERRLVLVTSHRRENFGAGLASIFQALVDLTERFPDIEVVYPVHPNPHVRCAVEELLVQRERIHLLAPLDYEDFCFLMNASYLILTDSGGVQEEAPTLHKPVLVLRDTSERPEVVEAGAAQVVGTDRETILAAATRLLSNRAEYERMAATPNPFGDGRAAQRIVEFLCRRFRHECCGEPEPSTPTGAGQLRADYVSTGG